MKTFIGPERTRFDNVTLGSVDIHCATQDSIWVPIEDLMAFVDEYRRQKEKREWDELVENNYKELDKEKK